MNRRTHAFKAMFDALPISIQEAARAAFVMFLADPSHPGLRAHALADSRKGQHLSGSVSVSVTLRYRAIYIVRDGVNVWYWIGSHADNDQFTGRK